MEPLLKPLCLDEYCNYFGVDITTLTLPCIFCHDIIDALQLSIFRERKLSLVWRGQNCYAACLQCVSNVAKIERERYFQCLLKGEYIEHCTQTPLQSLIVRCLYCMSLLSGAEKIDVIASGGNFCLVRCHWKGVCHKCSQNAWGDRNY
uniref:Protein E6 n=1 Tax=Human papillomavirus TaxID=10566 RepID=A0A385PLJ4_9PAPI|nr:MAG: E6 protein [Human papillomavirus]